MSITPISAETPVAQTWAATTISAAQRTLDNIVYAMKRDATKTFANRIQGLIDSANEGKLKTTEIVSLSSYVTLLGKYEDEGGFCDLHELSDRLNAAALRSSFSSSTEEIEESQVS